jgi:hypothetical protein
VSYADFLRAKRAHLHRIEVCRYVELGEADA